MPVSFQTPLVTPNEKLNLTKTVHETPFRSKLKRKVKLLTKALTLRHKSVGPSVSTPLVCQHRNQIDSCPHLSPPTVSPNTCLLRETPDVNVSESRPSHAVINLTQTFNNLEASSARSPPNGDNPNSTVEHERRSLVKHDSKAMCVVELFHEGADVMGGGFQKTPKVTPKLDKTPSVTVDPEPLVRPPMLVKSDICLEPSRFENLDRHALMVSSRDYADTTVLTQDLTENCKSELDMARVLFRWVIAMDQKNARDKRSVTSQFIGSAGFQCQKLFHTLCRQAGLHSKIIVGYSKGAGYRPGMRVDNKSNRNSWSAVAIDGTWRFVNCTWAARHMTGNRKELSQLLHKYDEFYFLTDPEKHIYQHFPDDPKWQLLKNPVSLKQFVNLPIVKSPFFKHCLQFASSYASVITAYNGEADIKLKAPIDVALESRLHSRDSSNTQINNFVPTSPGILNSHWIVRSVQTTIYPCFGPRPHPHRV